MNLRERIEKMKLTRKKAIELCIELWTWLAETGGAKIQWPGWEKYRYIYLHCFFCEYSKQKKESSAFNRKGICAYCPLYKQFGLKGCYHPKCAFYDWKSVFDPDDCKKYAKLFLGQIETIV